MKKIKSNLKRFLNEDKYEIERIGFVLTFFFNSYSIAMLAFHYVISIVVALIAILVLMLLLVTVILFFPW